ncbi:hypothetical protein KJ780_00200, partial [Candidatus Micrarchaeota archaeon]|nr:hypothetical protein [Candidatus Micrarchaeota archaeon]
SNNIFDSIDGSGNSREVVNLGNSGTLDSLVFNNNLFSNNNATISGSSFLYVRGENGTLANNEFINNTLTAPNTLDGFFRISENPTELNITNTSFIGNSIFAQDGIRAGGFIGISSSTAQNSSFTNLVFINNTVNSSNSIQSGGIIGIYNMWSQSVGFLNFENITIIGNSIYADNLDGGGLIGLNRVRDFADENPLDILFRNIYSANNTVYITVSLEGGTGIGCTEEVLNVRLQDVFLGLQANTGPAIRFYASGGNYGCINTTFSNVTIDYEGGYAIGITNQNRESYNNSFFNISIINAPNGSLYIYGANNSVFRQTFADSSFPTLVHLETSNGIVEYPDGVNYTDPVYLYDVFRIDYNLVNLTSSLAPGMNSSSKIQLRHNERIYEIPEYSLSNGEFLYCFGDSDPMCTLAHYEGSYFTFNATHFTSYRASNIPLNISFVGIINNATNVPQGEFTLFTLNISCGNFNCSEMEVSLDPIIPGCDAENNDCTDVCAGIFNPISSGWNNTFSGACVDSLMQRATLNDTFCNMFSAPGNNSGDCALYSEGSFISNYYVCPSFQRFGYPVLDDQCSCVGNCSNFSLSIYQAFNFSNQFFSGTPYWKGGLISNVSGTVPFWTNSSNPIRINLSANSSTLVYFWVNATGNVWEYYNFFAYANLTSNPNLTSVSEVINVTISSASREFNITLFSPASASEVVQNTTFPFTVNVSCGAVDCGLINVTLDPIVPGCDIDNDDCSDACAQIFNPASSGWMYANMPPELCIYNAGATMYLTTGDFTCDGVYGLTTNPGNSDCAGYTEDGFDNVYVCPSYERLLSPITSGDCSCADGDNPAVAGDCSAFSLSIAQAFNLSNDYFAGSGEFTKGIVSTTPGAFPFWTSTSNPSSLNLTAGSSQLLTFFVTATGPINSTYEFFAFANLSTDPTQSASTNTVNISIIPPRAVDVFLYDPILPMDVQHNRSFDFTVNVTCGESDCGDINVTLDSNGTISTIPGTTPFWTTTPNPSTVNLNASSSQLVTFSVIPTGSINSTHEFFAYVNLTSNLSVSSSTPTVDITIIPQDRISLFLISPTSNLDVSQGDVFSFIMNVSCGAQDCGNVSVTLDPIIPGCDIASDDCSNACSDIFQPSTTNWSYQSFPPDVCFSQGLSEMYLSVEDIMCDSVINLSSNPFNSDCAAYAEGSNDNLYVCPSYDRLDRSIDPTDCVCADGDNLALPGDCSNFTLSISEVFNFNSTYFRGSFKGIISTIPGTIPFWTNSTSNPLNISLSAGESQFVIFWVNTTASVGFYEFFAFANLTNNPNI